MIQGPCFPAMSAMLAKWAPVGERARMSAFIYAGKSNFDWTWLHNYRKNRILGSQAGTIIAFPLSGLIADSLVI